jgi:hypothetical protein
MPNLQKYSLIPLLFMLAWLQGCATVAGPYKAAETAEQKAFALYGTFVVFEERGASVINDQRVDLDARRAIQRADAAAKPVADSLLDAALEVNEVRQEIGASENRLETVTRNLENWIMRFEPLVAQLVSAVKGAR